MKFVICDRADYEWSREQLQRAPSGRRAARCCFRPAPSNCQRGISPTGSLRTACRCACSCSCTRSSGAMSRANERLPTDKAVVLLSGGLDSATVLAIARTQGFRLPQPCSRATVSGMPPSWTAAAQCRDRTGRAVASGDARGPGAIGGSALTDHAIAVPVASTDDAPVAPGIPVTYVPARNTLLLALATGAGRSVRCRASFSSASMPSTIQAIRIAGRSSSPAFQDSGAPCDPARRGG